jgi:hypothetical protein
MMFYFYLYIPEGICFAVVLLSETTRKGKQANTHKNKKINEKKTAEKHK